MLVDSIDKALLFGPVSHGNVLGLLVSLNDICQLLHPNMLQIAMELHFGSLSKVVLSVELLSRAHRSQVSLKVLLEVLSLTTWFEHLKGILNSLDVNFVHVEEALCDVVLLFDTLEVVAHVVHHVQNLEVLLDVVGVLLGVLSPPFELGHLSC